MIQKKLSQEKENNWQQNGLALILGINFENCFHPQFYGTPAASRQVRKEGYAALATLIPLF